MQKICGELCCRVTNMTANTTDLNLNASFDRDISWWRGRSCRYLVIEIAARNAKAAAKRSPHDLAIAIDASSSMAPALLSVQHLAKGITNRLGTSDRVAVISFADEARTELAATLADDVGKASASAAIDGIEIWAGSDFTEGWLAAAEQVAAAREKHPDDFGIVIIASDGKANRGLRRAEEIARYAADLRDRGISTAAVAPGPKCDLSLLVAVDDPEGLQDQFGVAGGKSAVDALASNCLRLSPEIAKDVEVCVTTPPQTEISVIGTISFERDGERLSCSLGNIGLDHSACLFSSSSFPRERSARQQISRSNCRGPISPDVGRRLVPLFGHRPSPEDEKTHLNGEIGKRL